ncbi:ENTH-domain-containing protein [Calocera cornea HHB12733]|uniref:ENTH-domain-containing protein n=1 Tax=Calocera cornea HHB12733 TaxID=1353952 RepID=A0A165GEF8_9BASI|nr:ENTH-domain-containing protein [Calocera cornea HHB12733]
MSLQTLGKGALRVAKNYTKGYSDVQAKVRDATSNDPWGPSGSQMNEIAQMTYDQNHFVEIMEMLDKRLNDKGKNWRHVWKSLTLLDYLLHAGSENVVIYFKDNAYIVKTLKEFQFIDEYSKDQGANVRQKAKDISNLLTDDERLRRERRTRRDMRDRLVGGRGGDDPDENLENLRRRSSSVPPPSSARQPRRRGTGEEDDLRRALELSKQSAQDEESKRRTTKEQDELERALALSREEAEREKRNAGQSSGLFDVQDAPARTTTNPNDLIDFSLNAQPTAQFNNFNQNPYYAQLQAQQQAQQQAWLQQQAQAQAEAQQQQWMQEQLLLQQQQAAQAQQQAQQQAEWERMQLMIQQQQQQQQQQQMPTGFPSLMAQPTGFGSNNPFATFGSPTSQSPAPPMPSLPSSFSQNNVYNNLSSPAPDFAQNNQLGQERSQSAPIRAKVNDQANPALAAALANREDGMDTFGNLGNLRFGQTQYGRSLAAQATGAPGSHNPFGQFRQQGQQGSDQPFFSI